MGMTRKFKDNEENHEKQDLQQKLQIETDKYNQEHCARVAVEAELKKGFVCWFKEVPQF
jgi:hypothetical protein